MMELFDMSNTKHVKQQQVLHLKCNICITFDGGKILLCENQIVQIIIRDSSC